MADTQRPRINVLLRSAQSDGEVALTDNRIRAGAGGPPLHHHDFDEAFYVLEGELTIQLAASVSTLEAGELAFARRGTHHTLANLSDAPARLRARLHAGRVRALTRLNDRAQERKRRNARPLFDVLQNNQRDQE